MVGCNMGIDNKVQLEKSKTDIINIYKCISRVEKQINDIGEKITNFETELFKVMAKALVKSVSICAICITAVFYILKWVSKI
jgi:hypothetical protein